MQASVPVVGLMAAVDVLPAPLWALVPVVTTIKSTSTVSAHATKQDLGLSVEETHMSQTCGTHATEIERTRVLFVEMKEEKKTIENNTTWS